MPLKQNFNEKLKNKIRMRKYMFFINSLLDLKMMVRLFFTFELAS
jgi:hypothetical protein